MEQRNKRNAIAGGPGRAALERGELFLPVVTLLLSTGEAMPGRAASDQTKISEQVDPPQDVRQVIPDIPPGHSIATAPKKPVMGD